MGKIGIKFELVQEDLSDYLPNIGRGNITKYYVSELPHGWIVKSVFERIEHEDNVILHDESMIFVPKSNGAPF